MEVLYMKEYSYNLGRDMEYKVYGDGGRPIIVFPAQDGRFFDYENFGMVDALANYIDSGAIQLFCVDSIDIETWSAHGNESDRIGRHEAWVNYIKDELLKRVYDFNLFGGLPYLTGCSMGASHALNLYLRYPESFAGCIALSGVYHASYFFPNYNDTRIYYNSPTDYLPGMSDSHPHVAKYRQGDIIVCVGRGSWETESLIDTAIIQEQFNRLGVPAWVDYWGEDVAHDWPWWRRQIAYFVGKLLEKNQ